MESVKAWALRHKVWSAVLVLFVIGVIGSAVSGNSSSDQPTTYYNPSTVAASSDDSGDLASWAGEASAWSQTLEGSMGTVSSLLSDSSYIADLLSYDQTARAQLDDALAPLENCSATWPSAPNVAKAQRTEEAVLEACSHFESGAQLLKEGVDSRSVAVITEAGTEITLGSSAIQRASAALGS